MAKKSPFKRVAAAHLLPGMGIRGHPKVRIVKAEPTVDGRIMVEWDDKHKIHYRPGFLLLLDF